MTTPDIQRAAQAIRQRVDSLELAWLPRSQAVSRWYKLIRLENDLAQDGMESVIGNSPRTSYNLATWLLTPKTWSIGSLKSGMSDEQTQAANATEQLVEREVSLVMRGSRGKISGSYLSRAIRLLVTTGWICLVSAPTEPRWTINAWHPLTTFPDYTPDGTLAELGRKYSLTAAQAMATIYMEGWIPPVAPFRSSVVVRQLWVDTPDGTHMAVLMDGWLVRPMGPTMFQRMPVYCQPAGGLPDDGTILPDRWRADVGQSLVASVLDLQKNYDRTLTYMQQLLRDTANPKWVERSEGPGVVKPEDIGKRGVVWNIGLADDIWAVQPPSPPVDLRTHAFDLHSQVQRGTFSDASFSGQDISAFLMANITSSTKQMLQPFLDTVRDANGELFSRNLAMARQHTRPIGGVLIPDYGPDSLSLEFQYDVEVPGDFLQRANSARMLNPAFRLSQETITRIQFPEVKDPFEERLRLTTEDAASSDLMVAVKTIREFRQAAVQANLAGDGESEVLLMRAADRLEAQVLGSPQAGQTGQSNAEAQTFRDMVRAGA